MASTAQRLKRAHVPIEEFPQSVPNLTAASQNLFELVQGRNLLLYPDKAMRLAVSRAVAVESSRGWRISKEKQSHKIDVVVALAMACHAAVESQGKAQHPQFTQADVMAVRTRGQMRAMGFFPQRTPEEKYGERAWAMRRRAAGLD